MRSFDNARVNFFVLFFAILVIAACAAMSDNGIRADIDALKSCIEKLEAPDVKE